MSDILTKQSFIDLIVNSDNLELNVNSIKERFSYYIVNSIENELKAINYDSKLSNYDNDKKYEIDFINRIGFYYYSNIENVALYKSTLENIKLLFSYDDIMDFIKRHIDFNTNNGWYIKYDLINKKPLDITTSGVISWLFFKKDFQMWILEHPEYTTGLKTNDIIVNLDSYIKEAIQQTKEFITKENVVINNENKIIHLKKYNYNRSYCNYNCTIDRYSILDENNLYINQYNIASAENKRIPLFCNSVKFKTLEAVKQNDFINKNFTFNSIYDDSNIIDIEIKNTNIRITFYKNNVIRLHYKNRYVKFYAINENNKLVFYEYDSSYRNSYIRQFYLSKLITGSKTYEIIKKAIAEVAEV